MRRSLVLFLVLATFAAACAGALAAKRGWHSIGKESANGGYAIAVAGGNVSNPHALAVKVTASPNQSVSGSWLVVCSKGTGAGTKEGDLSGTTTLVKHLRMPYANPSSCTVSASAQLDGSGRISVNLLAR